MACRRGVRHVAFTVTAITAWALSSVPSPAADVYLADYDEARKQGYLYIHGIIELGDAARFATVVLTLRQSHPGARIAVVSLISPGGRALEAANIAEMILEERAITMVAPGRECSSACVMLLMAGKRKLVDDTARVGIHNTGTPNGGEDDLSMSMTTDTARLYAKFGVPPDVIGRMVTTPPNEIYWLSSGELRRMGVDVMPSR